jgi:hypothetical protein
MPRKSTIEKAREDQRRGKAPSTQAGEFVHEEIKHIREGKHGARNTKQAIAIGLSKARRAGVDLPPPREGTTSSRTRRKAEQDLQASTTPSQNGGRAVQVSTTPRRSRGRAVERGAGKGRIRKPSPRRSRATRNALQREGRAAASPRALSRQAKEAAARRKRRGPVTPPAQGTAPRKRAGGSRKSA